MKKNYAFLLVSVLFCAILAGCGAGRTAKVGADYKDKKIVANPMNLNYRFQFGEPSRREAADPVCEYFNGKYYLFASKSGGYWSSEDLYEWKYIPCKTITTIEHYAPAILVMDGAMYFMSSSEPKIFRNTNPDEDAWEDIGSEFEFQIAGSVDPAFFRDDDGRVYIYWGCSDKDPIIGVEVDPANKFRVVGEAKILIEHNPEKYGWEVPGNRNDEQRTGWNEGPCMVKYKGRYYLQYAAPGTEYRTYGDGIYVADSPLGPYTYMDNSPFSFKPGGFIAGAGHGHTFQDKYGNYWHVASMTIAVRHMFERRLGLFPVYFSDDDRIYEHTVLTDYPYYIPQEKVDFNKTDLSMGWNMLSYNKTVSASSVLDGFDASKAVDEQIETWWSSETGNAGEWLQVDLGRKMTVNAVQMNFSDQDFSLKAQNSYFNYQYNIECSDNGKKWSPLVDRTANEKDMTHELIMLDSPVKTRYLRVTNTKDMEGKFSVSGFRVFGDAGGKAPAQVTGFTAVRNPDDSRRAQFSWYATAGADGYILRWGIAPDKLNNAVMLYDVGYEAGFFNRDTKYYFSIDAFNGNGAGQHTQPEHAAVATPN